MAGGEDVPGIGSDPAGVASHGQPIHSNNRPTRGHRMGDGVTAEDFAAKGREASGWTSDGRMIMNRFVEGDGVSVPGDDPLYQFLGMMRVFHEEQARQSTENLVRLETQMRVLGEENREYMKEIADSFRNYIADELNKWRASIATEMDKWRSTVGTDYDAKVGAMLASVDAAVAVQRQRERDAAPAAFSAAVAPTIAKLEALVPRGSRPGRLLNTMTRDRIAELALFAAIFAGIMSALSFYLIAHQLGRL